MLMVVSLGTRQMPFVMNMMMFMVIVVVMLNLIVVVMVFNVVGNLKQT